MLWLTVLWRMVAMMMTLPMPMVEIIVEQIHTKRAVFRVAQNRILYGKASLAVNTTPKVVWENLHSSRKSGVFSAKATLCVMRFW